MIVSYFTVGAEHRALAERSAASVRAVYPDCQIWMSGQDKVTAPMMVANLDSQIDVLRRAPRDEAILFLDTDILLRRPLPFGNEDMMVTWRDHVSENEGEKVAGVAKIMPYNYGVVGCWNRPVVLEAFLWMRARILQMAPMYQQWYGNQLALAQLACAPVGEFARRRIKWSATDPGTEIGIRYLPCDTFNYTPEAEGEDVADKAVLHFKGNRKHLMAAYEHRA